MTTAMGAALRRIQLGNALSAFGNGFTVPYLYVYVAKVRGLGAGTAGLTLFTLAVAALVVLPFTGRAIDRRGPLPVAIVGTVSAAIGSLGLGLSSVTPLVIASAAALGAGIAVIQPSLATMIVWCSTPLTRSRSFATQFFLNNLGLGVGGLIGGLMVDENAASSFIRLFGIESLMFLVLGATVATVKLPESPRVEDAVPTDSRPEGAWRTLLRDRSMVWLCVLGFVMFFACYGQFESGLAAYATEVTHVSPATLGLALFANTAAIVVTQFVVLKLVEGRRRSRVMALVGLIWTVAWVAAALSGLVHGAQAVATGLLISTYVLFGVGESMLSPTVAPLVADLAPASLIGQYNSAFALVKQLAMASGPLLGALLVGLGLSGVYVTLLIMCSLGITALALRLGRRLTAAQDNPLVARAQRARAAGPAGTGTGTGSGTETETETSERVPVAA
ncbi:MFS transporter [Streptomyces abikoensis]|uniref:MFS transporter n=1 Tax=Streptomyces abikoensis TaxID=97398 RepID=UPI001E52C7A0|nr:MFS transporter [Streptomyces abikoensis]